MTTKQISAKEISFSDDKIWDYHAQEYDSSVGRSSSRGISHLISLVEPLDPPLSSSEARVIDLGAGTGSLAFQLTAKYPNLPILATDISSGMLDQIRANPLATPNITTQVADMRAPVGGAATEGSFSHAFSTFAIQCLYDPVGEGTLAEWSRLLKKDGIMAIAVWDFDRFSGNHALWGEAATTVDPTYVNPKPIPPGYWVGMAHLEEGLKAAGFKDVKTESHRVGFNLGKEGFMRWFWESRNPMPLERKASFKGDLTKVRVEMERLLDEVYDGGKNIPLSVGVAVGRKTRDM